MPKVSAGILIYRFREGKLQVYLVHPGGPFHAKKDAGNWGIPKGEIDEGEDYLKCAVREVKEEIGFDIKGTNFIPLGSITQKGGKVVHAWAYESNDNIKFENANSWFEMEYPPRSGIMKKFPEIDKGEFFFADSDILNEKIKPAQKDFIERLKNYVDI